METDLAKSMKERIMAYLHDDAAKPQTDEEIIAGMDLKDNDLAEFGPALKELEEHADIIKTRNDRYGLPSRMSLVVGRVSMSAKGFAFLIPDVKETEEDTDVFVPGVHLNSAMHNDRVVARVTPPQEEGRSREGDIIRIVERANTKIVGTFESSRTFGFVTPDNTKLNQDIFIPKKAFHGAKVGMKVVVEITKWPEGRRNAEGNITELLGMSGDPGVDVVSIMRQYDLSEEFPEDVQASASAMEKDPVAEEYEGRRDRRDFHIVTVDGDDSKDLDDGVYCEKHEDGTFFLGVYIADVSWYVRENEPLDREARERGTSVYLVDRVIPMLPKELSNGICSLNAGVDRLSMACEMQIGRDGTVTSYEILPVVIHVYRRLTYNIVNKVLVDKDPQFVADNADILPMLQDLEELRGVMKAMRHRRGSIDFDLPEVKVKLDNEGHPVALIKREGSLAESIIEQCMLAANETVAEHMDKKHLPFIYRVHEQPTEEKVERLNKLLAMFGQHVNPNEAGEIAPKDVERVLESVKDSPEERIISAVSLRSMQQARYADQSLGHFGLAARYYTHFTSPIRRYPDLMVHRMLRETFATGTTPQERQEKNKAILPDIAEHASQRERVAIEAERDTTDMKEIEYMSQFEGQDFKGVISGVTAFGIFVELDNGVEGLVHVSSIVDDYYEYQEDQYALVGQTSHKSYRLGDEVEVTLMKANVEERNIDFILKGNGEYRPAPSKKRGGSRPAGGHKPYDHSHGDHKSKPLTGGHLIASHHGKGRRKNPDHQHEQRHSDPKHSTHSGNAPQGGHSSSHGTGGFGRDRGRDRREHDPRVPQVKGLNHAVWPDPPDMQKHYPEKEIKAPDDRRPRPKSHHYRKTEGGTSNNK
jgi:ribonuclease R